MSASITLNGRLTADPELRFTPAGKAVASFTVATSRRKFDKTTNQWEDADTTFWNCSAWETLAEQVAENLTKGTAVVVSGSAYQRNWETKDGEKRSRIEVRVDHVGADLRWAKPADRSRPNAPASDDPWASSPNGGDDAPPF